jgi:hypothetical protein
MIQEETIFLVIPVPQKKYFTASLFSQQIAEKVLSCQKSLSYPRRQVSGASSIPNYDNAPGFLPASRQEATPS